MKNQFDKMISLIKYKHLELLSYILLIIWSISPVIEYILKKIIQNPSDIYFTFSIFLIGNIGIVQYLIYVYKKSKDKSLNKKDLIPQALILTLLVLSIIATMFAKKPMLSLHGESYRKEGLIVYIMYIGFVLSASIITNKKYIKNVFKIIIASALFITIMPLFKSNFTYTNFSNIFYNTNHYGYYLMISGILSGFMFIYSTKIKKIIYLLGYIILTYMLVLNDTFGCYLSISICLFFAFIYSLIKKYKRIDIIILIITFILTSFLTSHFDIRIGSIEVTQNNPETVSKNVSTLTNDLGTLMNNKDKDALNKIGSGRGQLWKEASKYIIKHPLIGGGMECLGEHYYINNVPIDRPHNIILQVSAFIGIPGAVIYLALIVYLAISNLKYLNKDPINLTIYIAAMCYFISSNFGNSMYYTSPYFMILLGFLISMKYINNEEQIKE